MKAPSRRNAGRRLAGPHTAEGGTCCAYIGGPAERPHVFFLGGGKMVHNGIRIRRYAGAAGRSMTCFARRGYRQVSQRKKNKVAGHIFDSWGGAAKRETRLVLAGHRGRGVVCWRRQRKRRRHALIDRVHRRGEQKERVRVDGRRQRTRLVLGGWPAPSTRRGG